MCRSYREGSKRWDRSLPRTRDSVKPQGVFTSEKGPALPTICKSNSQRSRLCHLLPHVPRCPHFLLQAPKREHLRSRSQFIWGIILLSISLMGESLVKLSLSTIFTNSKRTTNPATRTEVVGTCRMVSYNVRWAGFSCQHLTDPLNVQQKLGWRSWTFISSLSRWHRERPSRWQCCTLRERP